MNVVIPEALHICPGCEWEIVEQGGALCGPCRYHEAVKQGYASAARANALYAGLPRETGVMPESRKLSQAQREALRGFIRAGIIAIGIAFWLWVAVDVLTKGRGL